MLRFLIQLKLCVCVLKPTRCTNFSNLFLEWNSTCFRYFLCPLSVFIHCTHSSGICHTVLLTACKLWKTPDDGQWNCPKPIQFHSKNKFEKLVHLVAFNIPIYHDARSHERQIKLYGQSKDRTLSVETMSLCLSVCDRVLATKPPMDYRDTPVAYKLVKQS
jgi:hypothetical protein